MKLSCKKKEDGLMDIRGLIEYLELILDECVPSKGYSLDSTAPLPDLSINDIMLLVKYLRDKEGMDDSDVYWFNV